MVSTLNLGDPGFQGSAPKLENSLPDRLPSPLSPSQLLSQVGCSLRVEGTPAQPLPLHKQQQAAVGPKHPAGGNRAVTGTASL